MSIQSTYWRGYSTSTRTMEFMYNQEDNFTNCRNLKDTIHSLLTESFMIHI
ncbi:hypothetical protein EE612_059330 [Oryza sativa]|nr:hypothetical protein EE612_059330 [Oryza sativa]